MGEVEAQVMETTAPIVKPIALPALTGHDRCDRCGAQAYVRTQHAPVEGREVEMFWCKHHLEEHADALAPLIVIDDRHKLNFKPA